jgi:hypothetical protein
MFHVQKMFGIIKLRQNIKVMPSIFVILIVIQYYPFIRILYNNPNYFMDTNQTFVLLQEAKLRELDLENKYQVTAIILRWKRLLAVQRLIQYYVNSKLFKEIIVWNNNPEVNITYSQIVTNNNSSILIRIINSQKNLKDEAKYRACTEARTLVCFYIDDDWNPSRYMKSLIASFRSDPNLLHSATNAVTYYNNMLWTFTDTAIDLHTGFSWIGSGSVYLREHAVRHLKLLMIHVKDQPGIYQSSIWVKFFVIRLKLTQVQMFFSSFNPIRLELNCSTDQFSLALNKFNFSLLFF